MMEMDVLVMSVVFLAGNLRSSAAVWIEMIVLVLLLYNLIMMSLCRKSDVRHHERYEIHLPVDIYNNGLVYHGEIENVSKGGFAFFVEEAVYIPKDEEAVEYRICNGADTINLKGSVVHVDQKKKGWVYSVKISDLPDEDLKEYMMLVAEQKKSEPVILRESFAYIMTKNLIARTKRKLTSRRKTARINVEEICELEDGTVIILENYNFEYIRVSLVRGMLLEKIILFPSESYEMRCTQSPWNPYLYSVDNQEELAHNEEFQNLLHQWNLKALKR